MRHLDLFSGIGGFAIAVDEVWPGSEHIFCDNDKFCQQVLKKHWPNSKIYEDIKTITNAEFSRWNSRGSQTWHGRKVESKSFGSEIRSEVSRYNREYEIDLLTGGFPCQPFSQAGKRKGTDDDRYLWPEMLRVIQLAKPQWVIAENVRGLLTLKGGVVFEQVCLDLEGEGYEVQPFIVPAVAVNAPHRRDRVWIVGNSTEKRCGKRNGQEVSAEKWKLGKHRQEGSEIRADSRTIGKCYDWTANWLEVATSFCRMDDGLPAKLDGFELSKARHRVERLKALGNAIVPAVAVEIMKAIKYQEDNN
ncbi:MAG: DNA (cytosine-5-)-methyltransferase [Candidatus Levybacteria bacterium]|nr:DNA (cytosine-5-)-methyltransferase [Candidatus Levybacteria bacterium]